MTKRKVLLIVALFALLVTVFALTVSAADNTPVKVKVQTSIGSREINTTVGKLFTVSTSGSDYTITGIKSFDNYSLTAIKEIHIPYDATAVRVTTIYSSVEKIIFDDYSKASVESLVGFTNLKELQVGSSATVTFASSCLPNIVESMNFAGSKSTVTFFASCFSGKSTVKNVTFGTNSKYNLGQNCFSGTGIENLELTDGATFNFTGTGAFSSCTKLKYVYLGTGVSNVNNSPFDACDALEMAYVAAATNIADNAFRRGSSEKAQLKVYVHTTAQVTISSSAFTNRSTKGVVVCALSTTATSFSNCKYELHVGIQHAYKPASTTQTCYNSYVTDCTCGQVKNAYYKLYQSGKSMQIVELVAGSNPNYPHDFADVDVMNYENGIFQSGVYTMKCKVCAQSEGVERIASPVITFAGYSVAESGTLAMVIGIRFDSESIKLYENSQGKSIDFGIVLASATGNPLDANGNPVSSKSVYKFNMKSLGIYEGTLKLSGFSAATINKDYVLAGYMKIGSDIYYIQRNALSTSALGLKYSQLA